MNANHVGALYPDSFGNVLIGHTSAPVGLGSTGNAVATIPTIGTNYIVRRITVQNANGSVALANVTIINSSDGVVANAVSNAVVLGNITATTKYQDLGLTANTATPSLANRRSMAVAAPGKACAFKVTSTTS